MWKHVFGLLGLPLSTNTMYLHHSLVGLDLALAKAGPIEKTRNGAEGNPGPSTQSICYKTLSINPTCLWQQMLGVLVLP